MEVLDQRVERLGIVRSQVIIATSISIAIMGNVSSKNVLKRSGAIPEDEIWVTNEVGYAALHFNQHSLLPKYKESISNCLKKRSQEEFLKPQPPLEFIQETKSLINSAIDLSDGLAGDLQHILNSSSVGAKIEINEIPMHKWFKENNQYELAMCGGEDYQILMTVLPSHPQPKTPRTLQGLVRHNLTIFQAVLLHS